MQKMKRRAQIQILDRTGVFIEAFEMLNTPKSKPTVEKGFGNWAS